MSVRIALVSREYPPFSGGGIGSYVGNAARALVRAGNRVHVITEAHDRTHARVETDGELRVHRLPVPGSGGPWSIAMLRFAATAARKVAELAAAGEVEVAEYPECTAPGWAAVMTRRMSAGWHVPTIVHLHTPTEVLFALGSLPDRTPTPRLSTYVLAERASILCADRLCAPSGFIADWAVAHYGLPERPAVIP